MSVSRIITFGVFALLIGVLGAWLFPTAQPPRRKLPLATTTTAFAAIHSSLADHASTIKPQPLSRQGINDLLVAYTLPEDPDRPPQVPGTSNEALKEEPDEIVAQVLAKGPALVGNGFDRSLNEFNLGRLALTHGQKDMAEECFKSAAPNSAAAKAYLSEFTNDPKEHFALLDAAIRGGFAPAKAQKHQFENRIVNELDDLMMHPGDPQKPAGRVGGVSDTKLANMRDEDLDLNRIIENYGEWAKSKTDTPRLCFGIGRAALWKEDYAEAQEYLTAAAKMGSPGAMAYLTKLPVNDQNFSGNVAMLQAAVKGGFLPAKDWLETASRLVFDPRVFTGATKVVSALHDHRVNDLLSGAIFFDDVDVQGPSQLLYRRAMLLDYMDEFANWFDGDTPSFVGDPKLLFGIVHNGIGVRGDQKLNETWQGILTNRGGMVLVIQKALEGDIPAVIRGATDPQGFDASLKQRREQVKQIAHAHARALFILKNKGNNAMDDVYGSAVQFINVCVHQM